MAKTREEMKRMLTTVIPMRQTVTQVIPTFTPLYKHPNPLEKVEEIPNNMCQCGCNRQIIFSMDSYIIIDDMNFLEDSCVTEYFIHEAGGRRVYGGAC